MGKKMTALYLHAVHRLTAQHFDEKDLRQQLKESGVDARRLNKFTQLALLAALPLKHQLQQDTNIYLASSFNSPSKFDKMFNQLMEQNLPSPLDFMANIHNATTFQLAQTLDLHGTSIFLIVNHQTALQPLLLAWNDLQFEPNKHALIGWAWEGPTQKSPEDKWLEGCVWWLVSTQSEGALAKVCFDAKKHKENRPHFLTFFNEVSASISNQQEIVL